MCSGGQAKTGGHGPSQCHAVAEAIQSAFPNNSRPNPPRLRMAQMHWQQCSLFGLVHLWPLVILRAAVKSNITNLCLTYLKLCTNFYLVPLVHLTCRLFRTNNYCGECFGEIVLTVPFGGLWQASIVSTSCLRSRHCDSCYTVSGTLEKLVGAVWEAGTLSAFVLFHICVQCSWHLLAFGVAAIRHVCDVGVHYGHLCFQSWFLSGPRGVHLFCVWL